MIVLLDTDILIDLALDRQPYAGPAGNLLDLLEQRPGQAFAAWHSFSNFYYLVAPTRGKRETRSFLLDLNASCALRKRRPRALSMRVGSTSRTSKMPDPRDGAAGSLERVVGFLKVLQRLAISLFLRGSCWRIEALSEEEAADLGVGVR